MNRNADLLLPADQRMTLDDRHSVPALDQVLLAAALATFAVTAASFLGRAFWVLELFVHFRLQLATGSVVLLVWALARRRLVVAMLAAIAAAANASPLIPYVMSGPAAAEAASLELRLMVANVSFRNSDYPALREAILREEPDIVGLLEVNQNWLDETSAVTGAYPHTILRPEEGAYGLALFSKVPVRELETSPYVEGGIQTALVVELELEEVPVTLMLAHVRAPTSPQKAALRNTQLGKMAEMLAAYGSGEQILIGDLNTTPWSPYYQNLEAEAHMANAALGQGYVPTWPSIPGLFAIPIDHCLVSDGLRVRQFRTGQHFGSDHLPIVVDLAGVGPDD